MNAFVKLDPHSQKTKSASVSVGESGVFARQDLSQAVCLEDALNWN